MIQYRVRWHEKSTNKTFSKEFEVIESFQAFVVTLYDDVDCDTIETESLDLETGRWVLAGHGAIWS